MSIASLLLLKARDKAMSLGLPLPRTLATAPAPLYEFSDEDHARASALRESLDSVYIKRYWRVTVHPAEGEPMRELIVYGNNSHALAVALACFPDPRSITLEPARAASRLTVPSITTGVNNA